EQNIASVRQLGFDGAAVLGAVWAFHTPESGTTQSARLDPLATLNRYRRLSRKWRAAGGTLQFISDGDLHKAEAFLQGGGRWVQLRMKNALPAAILKRAEALRSLCRRYNALMILNDQPYLAVSARADGVHLGQQDMSPAEARKIVGEGCIIGSTANTLDQIVACNDTETDYIGLGPFRFTTTKSNLSPILGLEGYRTLLEAMAQQAISLPVVAIGGIGIADLPALQSVGVRGIALSGAIAQAEDATQVTAEFLQALRTSSTPPILSTQALTSSCKQG
ncbi:MAG: thiamine phosphate synthase, partial [Alistipes sp.]|nr:thiamine phosphate synthase [Alistipes sp.]